MIRCKWRKHHWKRVANRRVCVGCGHLHQDDQTLAERFWKHVTKGPRCWEWIASPGSTGYGQIRVGKRTRKANQVAWELTNGAIPKGPGYHGIEVCHTCDNKKCVRPSHLFLGSHAQNILDMRGKGRAHRQRLLPHQIPTIIDLYRQRGASLRDLARRFKVTEQTIRRVVDRTSWKVLSVR